MEENYSSVENIALPWVKVYLVMLTISGMLYIYLCFTNHPTRLFTQQWLVLALFTYNTVQIIARRNPWKDIPQDEPVEETMIESLIASTDTVVSYAQHQPTTASDTVDIVFFV